MNSSGESIYARLFNAMKLPFKFGMAILLMACVSLANAQNLQIIGGWGSQVWPSALTLGNDGNFYGTTQLGGGNGTIFQATTNGSLNTLVSFNSANGSYPVAALTLGNDGNFYGTTMQGGTVNSMFPYGMGTIFRVTTNGNLTTLVAFNQSNGAAPTSALALGNDGCFYGTTELGGAANSEFPQGWATVFRVTTNGSLTSLADFGDSYPEGLTLGDDGGFYGTTKYGYSSDGMVFHVTTNGILTPLISFSGTNGAEPESALTLGNDGNLYGTTYEGGSGGDGTVFQLTTNGILTTLSSFYGTNGAGPESALILGNDGNFYGTTFFGGISNPEFPNGMGTVFQVTTNGSLTTLAAFNLNDGWYPNGLTLGNDGNFYGATESGKLFRFVLTPVITLQPQSQSDNSGATATFVCEAILQPTGFQWQKDGTNLVDGGNISGATNTTLTISSVSDSDAATYSVIVTNTKGSVLSSNAILTVIDPPSFTAQPTNLLVLAGRSASFGVTVTGSIPSFQWQYNTTNLFNATNAVYTIPSVGTNYAGDYSVLATNQAGSVMSSNAALTVVLSPTNQTCYASNTATFTAPSFGLDSLNYQWQKNGANLSNAGNISGATNSTLIIASVSDGDAATYRAVVSDANSGLTTSNAILTVIDPPSITAQPTNLLVLAGTNVVFGVTVTGTPPLRYQWLFNSRNLLNATNAVYTIPSVGTNYAGNFSVLVSNQAANVMSSNAALTVVLSPTNQTCYASNTATFTAPSFGLDSLNYQWQKNGANLSNAGNISGATNSTLIIASVSDADAATYRAVVSDANSGLTTSNAIMTVIDPPSITAQPTNLLVLAGTNVVFGVTVTGTPPLRYQWLFNSTNLLNATNAVYTIPTVGTNCAGNYSVLVSNRAANITSSNAALTVVLSPTNQTNYASSAATFVLTAASPETLNYQWQKNGTNLSNGGKISGATTNTLFIANISDADAATYSAVVSDTYTHVTTSNAALAVIDTLLDVSDPQSQTVLQGSNVTFNFTVYGEGPFLFQWFFNFNGSPLTSTLIQTNVGSITLTNVGLSQTGYYQAKVINGNGSLWSGYAYLTVIVRPTLNLQLLSGYPLLDLGGPLGYNFVVQYSTNLATANWIDLLSITNLSSSPYQFLDPSGVGQPLRFYRALFTQ